MKALISFIFLLYSVTLSSQERITLLFVGDLMQHRAQIDAARTSDGKYDYSPCFSLVKEEISRADIAIGNLEVTLGGKPYQGYPTFSAPDEYLQAIKDAGFDVLLTANNHCLDLRWENTRDRRKADCRAHVSSERTGSAGWIHCAETDDFHGVRYRQGD